MIFHFRHFKDYRGIRRLKEESHRVEDGTGKRRTFNNRNSPTPTCLAFFMCNMGGAAIFRELRTEDINKYLTDKY